MPHGSPGPSSHLHSGVKVVTVHICTQRLPENVTVVYHRIGGHAYTIPTTFDTGYYTLD